MMAATRSDRSSRFLRGGARLFAPLLLLAVAAGCGPDSDEASNVDSDEAAEQAEQAATDDGSSADDGAGDDAGASDEPDTEDDSGDADGDDPEADAEEGSEDEEASSADTDISAPTVTVVDQGAEPRVELRLDLAPELSEVMVMTQSQSLAQTFDGLELPASDPVTTKVSTNIEAAPADGGLFEINSEVLDVEVSDVGQPGLQAQLEANLAGLVGITTSVVIDDRGRQVSGEVGGLEGMSDAAAEQMQDLGSSSEATVPLPDEAVGVGAIWEVEQRVPTSGVEVEQTLRYELLSIEGSVIKLAVSGQQVVPPGAALESVGADAVIVLWELNIAGELTQDLTSLVPTSTVSISGVQEFEVDGSTLEQTIETTTEMGPG